MSEKQIYPNADKEILSSLKEPLLCGCNYVDWREYPDYIMMHRHENLAEVTLIVHGKGRYAVNNHIYDVKVGDVILCGNGVVHDAFVKGNDLYGTLTISIEGMQMPDCAPGQFLKRDQVPVFHLPAQYPDILSLMQEIRELYIRDEDRSREKCHENMLEILKHVTEMTHDQTRPVQKMDSFCLEIEEYINEHYDEDLSLESIANRFYISTFHLSHLFKKETGYNFKEYLMRMRIGEAQRILLHTDERIINIARMVGYEDASYFSRAFQKETGMTPREYRKYVVVMDSSS